PFARRNLVYHADSMGGPFEPGAEPEVSPPGVSEYFYTVKRLVDVAGGEWMLGTQSAHLSLPYRVQYQPDGSVVLGSASTAVVPRPEASRLRGHPNPARGTARLELDLEREAVVRVRVFDLHGRVVAALADGRRGAGIHPLRWDAPAPGLYFARATLS